MFDLHGKNILVTGGAGFVGSNLVKKLESEYLCQVYVLDDFFTGSKENLEGAKCQIIEGTTEDPSIVDYAVSMVDIVFHLAARNIIVSNKNPREDLSVNVVGSFNVFEACLKYKIKRVVYTSTSSIYGNPMHIPITECDPKSFLSFYSGSKFCAEVYAKTFFEVYELPISVVRYSNVYGYNQSPKNPYCGVVSKFIESAFKNEDIRIHGDGEQTRDFTFIDDAVRATIAAAISIRAVGNEYNIGTGIETSVINLAKMVIEKMKSKSRIVHIDKRDIDNIRRRVLNIGKIRLDLKFDPIVNMNDGLQKTIDWYRNTQDKLC
jgi:UDP-glucose 4-epimerase